MNTNVMARRKEVNSTLVTGGNHDRGDLSKGRRGVSSVGNEESRAFEEKERDKAGGKKVVYDEDAILALKLLEDIIHMWDRY